MDCCDHTGHRRGGRDTALKSDERTDEHGRDDRQKFIDDIAEFTRGTVEKIAALDKEKLRPERVELGPCPRCGAETGEIIKENSKAYGCTSWKSREETGCGFVIWKSKAGKQLPLATARELIAQGFTRRPVTGFKGRSGRSFRAKLALEQSEEEGRWRVEFDEPWAKEGAKPPEAPADGAVEAVEAGADEGAAAA